MQLMVNLLSQLSLHARVVTCTVRSLTSSLFFYYLELKNFTRTDCTITRTTRSYCRAGQSCLKKSEKFLKYVIIMYSTYRRDAQYFSTLVFSFIISITLLFRSVEVVLELFIPAKKKISFILSYHYFFFIFITYIRNIYQLS